MENVEKQIPNARFEFSEIQRAIKKTIDESRAHDYCALIVCYRSNKLFIITEAVRLKSWESLLLEVIHGHTTTYKQSEAEILARRAERKQQKESK